MCIQPAIRRFIETWCDYRMELQDQPLQDLALSLMLASAELLARVQGRSSLDNLDQLRSHVRNVSVLVQKLEAATSSLRDNPEAHTGYDQKITQDDGTPCLSCGNSIPAGRLEVLPGTQHCVPCAESFQKRRADPFERVSESDAQQFWKRHEQGLEDDRRRAASRRSVPHGAKAKPKGRRRKRRSSKAKT